MHYLQIRISYVGECCLSVYENAEYYSTLVVRSAHYLCSNRLGIPRMKIGHVCITLWCVFLFRGVFLVDSLHVNVKRKLLRFLTLECRVSGAPW